jgi:hypothetical protein
VEAARHWEKVWDLLQLAPSSEAGVALRRQATSHLLLFSWRLGMSSRRQAAAGLRSTGSARAGARAPRLEGADASAGIAAALDRAQALVQSTGARSYEPQIYVERGRLAALRSDGSGAQPWPREAHRLFTEMGATGYAERLAEELSRRWRVHA